MINDNNNDFIYDFAISYAGEDKDIADNIVKSLKKFIMNVIYFMHQRNIWNF